jgi:predicted dehydrogenase
MTRRQFSIAMGAGTALSASRVFGANDRLRLGLIGSGGRGREDWATFLKESDVEPVAVCDVYENFLNQGISMAAKAGGNAAGHKDYRRLLDRKDVDAVIVATPDHWHALITIAACEAGKDVYCEKPLSLTVAEGRKMLDIARAQKRVVQTGSQQRSGEHYIRAVRLIQDGTLGDVHRIHAGFQRNIFPGLKPADFDASKLDWDIWLGPAPKRPFDAFRAIYNFRWFWDYSGGQMTNWGAHHLDIARWILAAEAPLEVAGLGGRFGLTDGGETPDVQEVLYRFPKATVLWSTSEVAEGKTSTLDVYGSRGMMSLTRAGFHVYPETPKGSTAPAIEALSMKGADLNTPHARSFLDCVRSREKPTADIEEGHRTAVMCHLGNISTRLGRSIKWDAAKEQIAGDEEANSWLARSYRAPWKLT